MCSYHGFGPNRQQAIIWTNNDLVYWCMYTSLSLGELTLCCSCMKAVFFCYFFYMQFTKNVSVWKTLTVHSFDESESSYVILNWSPNIAQHCLYWKTLNKFVFTRGQFWPSGTVIGCVWGSVCLCVYQSRACLHNNSSLIQARITKCGPEMQNTWFGSLFWGNDRPWPSRSI